LEVYPFAGKTNGLAPSYLRVALVFPGKFCCVWAHLSISAGRPWLSGERKHKGGGKKKYLGSFIWSTIQKVVSWTRLL